jgi:N-acyl-D-amino-acid deacylase
LSSGRLTLLLKGGTVFDGTGAPPFRADVGISGDTVVYLGTEGGIEADGSVDISEFSVSPGFIDTHGHSEFTLLADPSAEGKVLQGITTEINGNCGLSAAPLHGEALIQREADLEEFGIRERWTSLSEYFDLLGDRSPALNFATLAGHGNIRASAMGYSSRTPGKAEMQRMKELLGESLEQGAMGLSTGLIYPPGMYSEMEEVVGLAGFGGGLAGEGFIYATHMRSEGRNLLEAIGETLCVGREAGVRVHISHIKTSGRENWDKASQAMAMLDEGRAAGLRVSCDRYPYTAASTDLDSVLPSWVFEGGRAEELKRLKSQGLRDKIRAAMVVDEQVWQSVSISEVATEKNRWMEGKSLSEVAGTLGLGPLDAVFHVLVEEDLRVGAIFHAMSEENLWKFLSLPYAMIGSDSSARSMSGPTRRGRPHPRGFGSFPRFLRGAIAPESPGATGTGRDVMALEEALRRVTGLPARTFGIRRRGLLKEGHYADIVVFDPEKLKDTATFDEPFSGL